MEETFLCILPFTLFYLCFLVIAVLCEIHHKVYLMVNRLFVTAVVDNKGF